MPIFAWALIRKEKQAFGWKGKKKNFSPLRIFIFRSLIHFEFIFVCHVRKCSNFILLHVAVQFPHHHFLKRLSFLHCIFLPPLSKEGAHRCMDLSLGFLSCFIGLYFCFCASTILSSKEFLTLNPKTTHVRGWKSYYLCDLNNSKLETVEPTYLLIITLNINGLNIPTKRCRLAKWIQKQNPYTCCL